ncbi:hypothetical protein [Edaphobacter aggregans]|uniref:hypothetical protein n=1 Tax=Edaphobacter aggregans TaxID=570835 RepID=UPI001FE0F86C|nr:hypothetical protein [Edaphobacter aggregans]
MERLREGGIVSAADGSVRGTQSFVHTLSECWRRPSLTALEVLWRWAFGIPALLLLWKVGARILAETPLNMAALRAMTVTNPLRASETLAEAMALLLPAVNKVAVWLAPLLLGSWVVWSSLGRTVVLRRVDSSLHARPLTLMVLQAIRVLALAGSFAVWFVCLQWAASTTVTAPLERGSEPNLVGYFALAIVSTLGLFTLWAVVSWVLSVAPLLAMLRNVGVGASLRAAFRLGPLKSKLVEINLVMGIVKIALMVLALVFSATPLPFESVTTPEFLWCWWIGVAVFYFVASDFFHVARLVGYLQLWRAYERPVERQR